MGAKKKTEARSKKKEKAEDWECFQTIMCAVAERIKKRSEEKPEEGKEEEAKKEKEESEES